MNFYVPKSIKNEKNDDELQVLMTTLDIDFLNEKTQSVLPSRNGISFPSSTNLSDERNLYNVQINLNPEWDKFLEYSVNTIVVHFHVVFEKG